MSINTNLNIWNFMVFRFYAKRCMLSLIENMTKHIVVMRDSFYNECLVFLNQCECKYNIKMFNIYLK